MLHGCYTLDLYCDVDNADHKFNEFPHQFTDPKSKNECMKQARSAGWKLFKKKHICPKCNKGIDPKEEFDLFGLLQMTNEL